MSEIRTINKDNLPEYYSDLEQFAEEELWYYDNSHIDYAEIVDKDIVCRWVFRENEPDDWEEYEEAWFPNDEDSVVISLRAFIDFINN